MNKVRVSVPAELILRTDGSGEERKIVVQTDFTWVCDRSEAPQDILHGFGESSKGSPSSNPKFIDQPVKIVVVWVPAIEMRPAFFKMRKHQAPSVSAGQPPEVQVSARMLACMCVSGQRISMTFRVDGGDELQLAQKTLSWWFNEPTSTTSLSNAAKNNWLKVVPSRKWNEKLSPKNWDRSAYQASRKSRNEQPVSIYSVSHQVHREVFFSHQQEVKPETIPAFDVLHGAVLVAGRTKSAKSLITRGMIHESLSHPGTYQQLAGDANRLPHLVTLEDPIEQLFEPTGKPLVHEDNRLVDYTPRDKTGHDYVKLSDAFENCLRQTPACVFVGEARTNDDIADVLNFAATGHLVFATVHAGSLIDVFTRLFVATKSSSAASRGLIGQRLLAVVHMQHLAVNVNGLRSEVVLPALWRRSPTSTAALVSGGVGSLMPNNPNLTTAQLPDIWNRSQRFDCLGRQYFARLLLPAGLEPEPGKKIDKAVREALISRARELDLHGT